MPDHVSAWAVAMDLRRALRWFVLAGLVSGCRSVPPPVELPGETSEPAVHDRVVVCACPEPAESVCQTPPDELKPLTLPAAIDYGLQNNPRLRQAAARVQAARAGETIAFSPFLPEFDSGFRYSGFNVPVLPGGSFVPASLNAGVTSFSLAEAGVQWTLYDFGRTAGRYGQAVSQTRVEDLSLLRARQTRRDALLHGHL